MRLIVDLILARSGKWINPYLSMDMYARKLFMKRNAGLMGIIDASRIWAKFDAMR